MTKIFFVNNMLPLTFNSTISTILLNNFKIYLKNYYEKNTLYCNYAHRYK